MNKIDKIKKFRLIIMVALAYGLLFVFNMELAIQAIGNSGYYLKEMLTIMPVIFMLIVAIDVLVPKELIVKRLGQNAGVKGGLLALVFGSLSVGPIYAAFPIVKMLLKKGASITSVVIILSAWATVKLPMLANEIKFLGFNFMAVRWVLTVAVIFAIGYLFKYLKMTVPANEEDSSQGLTINQNYCIGCGLCVKLAPDFYRMEDGKAHVLNVSPQLEGLKEHQVKLLQSTITRCPTKAIQFNGGK